MGLAPKMCCIRLCSLLGAPAWANDTGLPGFFALTGFGGPAAPFSTFSLFFSSESVIERSASSAASIAPEALLILYFNLSLLVDKLFFISIDLEL